MLLAFRIISYLEGISYLLLLGVGVPLKYLAEDPSWVKSLGMPHGLLFVAYIFLAIVIRQFKNWDAKTMVIVLLASIIPFGTFYVDKKYL
ncbi:MAG: integral membrane protein [Bacteroidia bacterium]|jgi:integral membrane protein|tara:strand:+ start:4343 stop:4612 length:270 start_codon:yes stop_codon:yes gene_type:complete